MKEKLFLIIVYCLSFSYSKAQEVTFVKNCDISINDKKILLIGEIHDTYEIHEIQRYIINDIINKNKQIKHFHLYLESPLSLQYYIENVVSFNDTLALKRYLQYSGQKKRDTLIAGTEAIYHNILYYTQMAKSMQNSSLKISCIDNEYGLYAIIFTILDILRKYDIQDLVFQEQLHYLDSLFSLHYFFLLDNYASFHKHFGDYFLSHKEFFQNKLSQRDYYYISEMLNRCPKEMIKIIKTPFWRDAIVTPERDIDMYNVINQHYNDNTFYIAILGRTHVIHSEANIVAKFQNKFKNVATLLETDKNSHFKKHTTSLIFCPLSRSMKTINKNEETRILDIPYQYPTYLAKYTDYLNSLLTSDNVTFINLKKTKLSNVPRYADYMIVIKKTMGI